MIPERQTVSTPEVRQERQQIMSKALDAKGPAALPRALLQAGAEPGVID
jgi:hypothetical protein